MGLEPCNDWNCNDCNGSNNNASCNNSNININNNNELPKINFNKKSEITIDNLTNKYADPDSERINKIIEEAAKNSEFYNKEENKKKECLMRIKRFRNKI